VRRNIVIGFFDTVYWSRRFRREMAARGASRMGAPPQISVPEIFVENPDDTVENNEGALPRDFTEAAPFTPARGTEGGSSSSSFDPRSASPTETTLRRRDSRSYSPTDLQNSAHTSPYLAPQRLQAMDTAYHGAGTGHRSESPGRLSPSHSRQGSSVSALGVLDSLDNSAWGESIRRSFTMRRPTSPSQP
jgi:voltage-dependent calcium channel